MLIRTFSLLMMAAFSAMLGLGIISPFLPELVGKHGANGFWIGMIFAGFGISRGIVTPFIGRISDRVGRKIFVVLGLLIYAGVSLLYPKAGTVYELTLVRLIHGLSAGMILPIVMAYAGQFSKEGHESMTTGVFNMVLYLGFATGPLIGGEVAERFGFNAVFYLMATLGAVTLFLVIFFLPEIKGDGPDRKIFQAPLFRVFYKEHYIRVVLIMSFISVAIFAVFMSFLPSIAIKDSVDMIHIGMIMSTAILVAGLLQIPFGRIADSHTQLGKILQSSVGIAISMLALFVLPFCPDFKALLLVGFFMGLGAAIYGPALSGISVKIGQKIGMGSWMGVFWSVMSIGLVFAPLTAGVIMDNFGINSVFYSFGIFAFLGLLFCAYYIRKRRY